MIRPARAAELTALTALCLRAKAHWGYDAAFMQAVVPELTLGPAALGPGLVVWDEGGTALGVAQVALAGPEARLEDLFVDPPAMGRGIGRALLDWALAHAASAGAQRMQFASDPFAEPFYRAMGARRVGTEPSGSIPGRMLPLMEFTLAEPPRGRG